MIYALRAAGAGAAGHALAVKKDVFAFERAGDIGFGHYAGSHLPVERAVGCHVHRLKALVITEGVGDPPRRSAVPADEPGESAVGPMRCARDVLDAVARIDGRERQPRCSGAISSLLVTGNSQTQTFP